MVKVCGICGSEEIAGTCDECNENCCDEHLKETGTKTLCPPCLENYTRD